MGKGLRNFGNVSGNSQKSFLDTLLGGHLLLSRFWQRFKSTDAEIFLNGIAIKYHLTDLLTGRSRDVNGRVSRVLGTVQRPIALPSHRVRHIDRHRRRRRPLAHHAQRVREQLVLRLLLTSTLRRRWWRPGSEFAFSGVWCANQADTQNYQRLPDG